MPINYLINNIDLFRTFLNNTAHSSSIDFMCRNKEDQTVFSQIISLGDYEITKIILSHSSLSTETRAELLNATDKNQNTPLIIACLSNSLNIIKLLLTTNLININHTNLDGKSALTILIENDNYDTFNYIITTHSDSINLNNQDFFGNTLSMLALKLKKLKFVSLLESKPQVTYNQLNNMGQSFISILVSTKNPTPLIRTYSSISTLTPTSNPNITNFMSQFPNCYESLMTTALNPTDKTPTPTSIDYDTLLTDILKKEAVDISTPNKFGHTPLLITCMHYDMRAFNALIHSTHKLTPDPKCITFLKKEAEKYFNQLKCNDFDFEEESILDDQMSQQDPDDWESMNFNCNSKPKLSTIYAPSTRAQCVSRYDKSLSNDNIMKKYDIILYFIKSLGLDMN